MEEIKHLRLLLSVSIALSLGTLAVFKLDQVHKISSTSPEKIATAGNNNTEMCSVRAEKNPVLFISCAGFLE